MVSLDKAGAAQERECARDICLDDSDAHVPRLLLVPRALALERLEFTPKHTDALLSVVELALPPAAYMTVLAMISVD